jgi:hypothetical protein
LRTFVRTQRPVADSGLDCKAALAALLALLLLAASTLSVSHTLHQNLHRDGAPGSHFCLVCSLAKGQLTSAEAAAALLFLVLIFLFVLPPETISRLASPDYRLSPSRAPPVR